MLNGPAVSLYVQVISSSIWIVEWPLFGSYGMKHSVSLVRLCEKMQFVILSDSVRLYEPRYETTGLRGFKPGLTKTRLYNHTRWLGP